MKFRLGLSLFLLAGMLAATSVFAEDLTGTLKKVNESGTITMGIRESSYPLSYLDDKQQPIGYHIEICNKIVEAVKRELEVNLKVQHQPVTSQNR
ncbi:MAG: transporter substrate-binding domain-containing protein, partial [Candidatus Deferrimicrobiaceae bacterium]